MLILYTLYLSKRSVFGCQDLLFNLVLFVSDRVKISKKQFAIDHWLKGPSLVRHQGPSIKIRKFILADKLLLDFDYVQGKYCL